MIKFYAIHPQEFSQESVWVLSTVPKIMRKNWIEEDKRKREMIVRSRRETRLEHNLMTLVKLERNRQSEQLTSPQKFTLVVRHRLDHILPITRIEEELAAFCIGNKFDEICIPTNR